MTSPLKLDGPDEIVRCLLAGQSVRVVAVTTTHVAREAARRHDAGPAAALALARGLTAGLLLATLTKDEERVTLQVLGDGPSGLTVDATRADRPRLRETPGRRARAGAAAGRAGPRAAIGRAGVVSVIRPRPRRELSGQTAIASGDRRGRGAIPRRQRADPERSSATPGSPRRGIDLPPASWSRPCPRRGRRRGRGDARPARWRRVPVGARRPPARRGGGRPGGPRRASGELQVRPPPGGAHRLARAGAPPPARPARRQRALCDDPRTARPR